MEHPTDKRLPVLVITGFLGTGKTTLVNGLVAQRAMANSAVVVNEFGEIGLDGDFVLHDRDKKSMVAGGCFCCSLSENFEAELMAVYSRARVEQPVDSVIVEASGLADPMAFVEYLIGNPVASRLFRLEAIICTVDAVFGLEQLAAYAEAAAQAAIADILLITKPDIAAPGAREDLAARLRSVNPRAPIETVLKGNIPVGRLAALREETGPAPRAERGHRHTHGIESFVLTTRAAVPWRAFARWLTSTKVKWSTQLLRVKGILYFEDEAHASAIHGVHHIFHRPVPLPHLRETDRLSRLVLITREADRPAIETSWLAMIATLPGRRGTDLSDDRKSAGAGR